MYSEKPSKSFVYPVSMKNYHKIKDQNSICAIFFIYEETALVTWYITNKTRFWSAKSLTFQSWWAQSTTKKEIFFVHFLTAF